LEERGAANLAIQNAVSDFIYRINPDGIYLDYWAQDVGAMPAPPGVFLGRSLEEVYPPEVATRFMHFVEKAFQDGGIQHFEYWVSVGRDARHREAWVVPTGAAEALVIVRDLTELKRAQEAAHRLQATAERRALLLDTVHQVALDILTASETGAEALRHIVEAARKLTLARWAIFTIDPAYQNGLPEFIAAGLPPAGVSARLQAEKSFTQGNYLPFA
jgi:hypothetical protein